MLLRGLSQQTFSAARKMIGRLRTTPCRMVSNSEITWWQTWTPRNPSKALRVAAGNLRSRYPVMTRSLTCPQLPLNCRRSLLAKGAPLKMWCYLPHPKMPLKRTRLRCFKKGKTRWALVTPFWMTACFKKKNWNARKIKRRCQNSKFYRKFKPL